MTKPLWYWQYHQVDSDPENLVLIREYMARLTNKQRRALGYWIHGNISLAEIGRALGISTPATRRLIRRALARISENSPQDAPG